jgi:glycosyltransferase involved in cell wall biosynthesis
MYIVFMLNNMIKKRKKNAPGISVLIPSFNREDFIEEALSSVLNQLGEEDELLVVDDGSTDNTKKILEKYRNEPRFRFIIKEHTNAPDTRNRAIREARNPWILWLDSDDILLPGIITHYRKYISRFSPGRCDLREPGNIRGYPGYG